MSDRPTGKSKFIFPRVQYIDAFQGEAAGRTAESTSQRALQTASLHSLPAQEGMSVLDLLLDTSS